MKCSAVAKTNIFVSIILAVGFFLLAGIYYRNMFHDSLSLLEFESSHKATEIYAKIVPDFLKAVKISKAMSKDSFLMSYLLADDSYDMPSFKTAITKFLTGYYKYNDVDGVFLLLEKNGVLYTQDGEIGAIDDAKDLHGWHDKSVKNDKNYDINIDFDKTPSANYDISMFVNYKIIDWSYNILGITGICIHLDSIMKKIFNLETTTNSQISFIDKSGIIQLSNHASALSEINWLKISGNEYISDKLEDLRNNFKILYVDTINLNNTNTHNYISIKYIPELDWYLVVETFTGEFWEKLKKNILYSGVIIVSLLAILITFISYIISKSERRAKSALEERMRYFQDAARNMFGSIYEIDVSKNIFSPESKLHQFDLLKNMGEQSYTDSLQLLAQRLIKKEYREVFLDKFSCRNVLLEFGRGTDHIGMDCQILLGDVYQWLRFDGYIFFVERDKSVHMYLYSKNVNDEVTILAEARNDALTGCLTRGATQQAIEEALLIDKDKLGAFFIMDIDNFKRANDTFGHGFGDYCIQQFANGIRKAFRSNDIVGRIGGDEFVVYLSCPDKEWVRNKARQLVQILNMDCVQGTACLHISASIGVAFYPENGTDMATLYKNADAALYVVKERGKNNFEFYESAAVCSVGKGFTEEED